MTGLPGHMFATAHSMLRRLRRRRGVNGHGDCENGQHDDQNKATRQRRDHEVEGNTPIKRSNRGATVQQSFESQTAPNDHGSLSLEGIHAKMVKMKLLLILASFTLALQMSHAQSIEIVSPDRAYTYAYGDAACHQIERDSSTNEMVARVTFSNYPFAGDREPRRDEMFDFVFPGLHFDATQNEFFARTVRHVKIPVARLHSNFPYAGYKLEPTAKIFLVKRSGRITAMLNATAEPRDGSRWVQIDDNWSLQNLLAFGLQRLTR